MQIHDVVHAPACVPCRRLLSCACCISPCSRSGFIWCGRYASTQIHPRRLTAVRELPEISTCSRGVCRRCGRPASAQIPPVASPPFRRCLSSRMPPSEPGRVNFVVKDEDLESDEALWALYERWCKAFGAERSPEEMHRYFDKFKDCVRHVDSFNKRAIRDGKSARLAVNKFADRKLAEQLFNDVPIEVLDRVPYSRSPIIGRAGHRMFNKKGSGEEDFPYKEGSGEEDFPYPRV